MKKSKGWIILTAALVMLAMKANADGPSKEELITISSPSTTATTGVPNADQVGAGKKLASLNSTTHARNSKLTGIPQIDYIWDPNLPRELRGYNLSSYPFFSTVPPEEDIHFKCDGLHDGFYAAIEFKCQVYHHCVYGIRHDFLCANFTAFDQKTFICHFVSDVDCEGSQKYWNRNDALYMATTTTSTTTTTTEPPPTRKRTHVRPQRPLRRPINRRPIDDYYYDDVDYDEDYYEEQLNRRRKQRPYHRKHVVDYEYEEKESVDHDDDGYRRPTARDRFHDGEDELKDSEQDRRKYDRPRNTPTAESVVSPPVPERRKTAARKPGTILARSGIDERRSFSDNIQPVGAGRRNKPKTVLEEPSEHIGQTSRRLATRRRMNEKRISVVPPTDLDDFDDYEKPLSKALDHEEAESIDAVAVDEDVSSNIKTTQKPIEFITPKVASVYARTRLPPRIARPVPVTEKRKFQYPVQKTATTVSPAAAQTSEEEYYEDELYYDVHSKRGHSRHRIVDEVAKFNDNDAPVARRRYHNEAPRARKGTRAPIRKPTIEKKPPAPYEEEYETIQNTSAEHLPSRPITRRRPLIGRTHNSALTAASNVQSTPDDVDFVDDDYHDQSLHPAHRLRAKTKLRKVAKKSRHPIDENDEEVYKSEVELHPKRESELRERVGVGSIGRNKSRASVRLRQPPTTAADAPEDDIGDPAAATLIDTQNAARTASVRVVKRPFLPSRGGSPYLPRGLLPVGVVLTSTAHTTDNTPIDIGSTISGVRLLEHGAPLLRDSGKERDPSLQLPPARTTQSTRSGMTMTNVAHTIVKPPPPPKISLDELYENDYDVTLNDALNPTLKPLTPHQTHNLHNEHHITHNYSSMFVTAPAGASAAKTFVNNNNQLLAIYHKNNKNNNNYQLLQQNQPHLQIAYQSAPHQSLSLSLPLSQSQTQFHHHQQLSTQQNQQEQIQQQQQPHNTNKNYNSKSYFSSTDIRRHAIVPPPASARSSRAETTADDRDVDLRIAQQFKDDFGF